MRCATSFDTSHRPAQRVQLSLVRRWKQHIQCEAAHNPRHRRRPSVSRQHPRQCPLTVHGLPASGWVAHQANPLLGPPDGGPASALLHALQLPGRGRGGCRQRSGLAAAGGGQQSGPGVLTHHPLLARRAPAAALAARWAGFPPRAACVRSHGCARRSGRSACWPVPACS